MLFIETSNFTNLITQYLSDGEYAQLQEFLLINPQVGELVRGSGGVRKLRWSLEGRGKRGGVRIIYYWKKANDEIWMLTVYSKNQKENISSHILKKIAKEINDV